MNIEPISVIATVVVAFAALATLTLMGFAQIDSRFSSLESRMDDRFAQVDGRIAQMDTRMGRDVVETSMRRVRAE